MTTRKQQYEIPHGELLWGFKYDYSTYASGQHALHAEFFSRFGKVYNDQQPIEDVDCGCGTYWRRYDDCVVYNGPTEAEIYALPGQKLLETLDQQDSPAATELRETIPFPVKETDYGSPVPYPEGLAPHLHVEATSEEH